VDDVVDLNDGVLAVPVTDPTSRREKTEQIIISVVIKIFHDDIFPNKRANDAHDQHRNDEFHNLPRAAFLDLLPSEYEVEKMKRHCKREQENHAEEIAEKPFRIKGRRRQGNEIKGEDNFCSVNPIKHPLDQANDILHMPPLAPFELHMWDDVRPETDRILSDDEINIKYGKRELRIVIESNREQLPNFVEALKRPNWMELRRFIKGASVGTKIDSPSSLSPLS
jgi:hypothetical protein